MAETVYSVGQVNTYIKNMFTQDYLLRRISVKGEVSNCKYHSSGHIYFTLKDASGTLTCVMFAGNRKGLAFRMEDGNQVIVSGGVSVYERDGKYQLYAQQIQLQGNGALYERYEQLVRELGEMGMFAQEYKQPIPRFVHTLGVVTASTGAAVRDIIQVSKRRNPHIRIILYPAQVQGDGAAESIVRGIEVLDRYGVDAIIVGRGGGSIEDLWAFNEELVARTIFMCRTPIVSAVGHETDITIADHVADLRAATPSAAAEMCVFDYEAVKKSLLTMQMQLRRTMSERCRMLRQLNTNYGMRLEMQSPKHQLQQKQQRLMDLEEEMSRSIRERLHRMQQKQGFYAEILHGLSPLLKLSQGYGYVQDSKGQVLKTAAQVKKGDSLSVQLLDGVIETEVKNVTYSTMEK